MDGVPHVLFDVPALETCLRERLSGTRDAPKTVSEVLRAFLDVATLPCDCRLWSLEFAFDEDEGRVARLTAMFAPRGVPAPEPEDLRGYEVHMLLPRILPGRSPEEVTTTDAVDAAPTAERLVARFLHALADLGAFRTIEPLTLRAADVLRV